MRGENLFVGDKGQGLYPYVVRNRDIMLRMALTKNLPPMSVRLLAEGLASRGVDALWIKSQELGSEMGLLPSNLTRIDIAVDFQGWAPTFAEMSHVVCKSNFRPVYPNTVSPQTFQFGKGAVVVRLYDKTAEIAAKNHAWWHDVWRLLGYDSTQPVWRLEVQLRSQALKELGLRDTETALRNIHDLFCYGLDWCSLRIPGNDSNVRRAPEHQAWIDLREKITPAGVLGRIRPVTSAMTYDACIARIMGLYGSAGAASGITDYDELCDAVKGDVSRFLHNRKEIDLLDFVEQKQRRMDFGE